MKTGYAPVNGLNMYYEIHGEGNMPLVLIHGGGSTIITCFSKLLPLLAKDRKVIAMELQAHGRTNDRDAPESFMQDMADVVGLLKYLGVEKADFCGFSNGGTTTLHIAIHHPELVNKIVVMSANYRRDGMPDGMLEGMKYATIKDMPAPLQQGYLDVTPSQTGLQTMFEKDRDRMVNFKDMDDAEISSIKAKALIMAADQDVVKVDHLLNLHRLIAGSTFVVLPGVHGAFIGEACTTGSYGRSPEAAAILISDFLN
ncbi:alpha/beta fold hydrolase [Taibaiella soli]|uniref:Alpha/beta hydrolase n=1 Tax=Taibaiella soli TaxID=1649169 RepID=A0A2W2AHT8_9BACT|nr:alpha/beta hydrolase [Taibaiella soli]PZF71790.1 alpha/beta hydrolase [Taibaiella soli]